MHADKDSNELKPLEKVWSEAFIFAGADEAVEEQNLAWALSLDDTQIRLYEPNSAPILRSSPTPAESHKRSVITVRPDYFPDSNRSNM